MLERFFEGWFIAQGLQYHFINFLKQLFFAQNSVTTHKVIIVTAKAPTILANPETLIPVPPSFLKQETCKFISASTSGIYFLINKHEQKWAHAVRAAHACCMEIHFISSHLKINTDRLLANYVISQAGDTFIFYKYICPTGFCSKNCWTSSKPPY